MAFTQNIPQPADVISQSQPQLLANFQAINTFVDVNHVAFNGADQGKHKFVTMPEQGAAPITLANEGVLFTAQGAYTGTTELYYGLESAGGFDSITEGLNAAAGWSGLPSGLLIKWGTVTIPVEAVLTQGTYVYNYPVGATIKPFSTFYQQMVTPVGIAITAMRGITISSSFTSASNTQFGINVYSTGTGWPTFQVSYLAIGI